MTRPAAFADVATGRAGTGAAVAAEWAKLWSLRPTAALAGGALVLMALATYQVAVNRAPGAGAAADPDVSRLTSGPIVVVVLVVVALAMTSVTSEYVTAGMRTTLLAVPQRRRLVLAKTVAVTGAVGALGVALTAVGTTVAAAATQGGWRIDPATAVGTAAATSAYLVVASWLTVGLALVVRTAVATLATAALVLVGVPAALGESWSPGGSGLAFVTDAGPDLATAARLLLFATWAVVALTLATRRFCRRDA